MNGTFAALVWAATVQGVQGAGNIVVISVWMLLLTTPLMFIADLQAILASKGRSVPAWVDVAFDLAMVSALLWHGWMVTGVAYLIHFLIAQAAWAHALKKPVVDCPVIG
ncbi:hypothetical protein [Rhodoferax antarcticus]|uniref:Uncharacterized protein n=1 Tax=Rhodoferax antarcticus ANT.BR TaxID=1111071 RepID=A0A1Q8Y8Y9_9BURK|nr:hypothetical protein [Rhodoferax antarcticus]OLP04468.1 hypothetical protein BLL52_4288 [Rhodoferax antarcticus ANT.BR]